MVRLDHATINTSNLDATVTFYRHFLGLVPGWRPEFSVGGAWLYPDGSDYAIVHVISRDRPTDANTFDHFAFRAVGLEEYLAKVKASGEWYKANTVVGTKLVQVQHYDPNNLLIEVNFVDEFLPDSEVR